MRPVRSSLLSGSSPEAPGPVPALLGHRGQWLTAGACGTPWALRGHLRGYSQRCLGGRSGTGTSARGQLGQAEGWVRRSTLFSGLCGPRCRRDGQGPGLMARISAAGPVVTSCLIPLTSLPILGQGPCCFPVSRGIPTLLLSCPGIRKLHHDPSPGRASNHLSSVSVPDWKG